MLTTVFYEWLSIDGNLDVFLGNERLPVRPSTNNNYNFVRRPDHDKSLKRKNSGVIVGNLTASQKKPRKRRIKKGNNVSNGILVEHSTVTKRGELPPVPRPGGMQHVVPNNNNVPDLNTNGKSGIPKMFSGDAKQYIMPPTKCQEGIAN